MISSSGFLDEHLIVGLCVVFTLNTIESAYSFVHTWVHLFTRDKFDFVITTTSAFDEDVGIIFILFENPL